MNNNYVLLGLSILAIASIYLFWLNFKQSREIQNLWSQIGQVGGDTPGIQEEFVKKIEQLGGNLDQLNKYVFGDLLPRLEEQQKFIVDHNLNQTVEGNDPDVANSDDANDEVDGDDDDDEMIVLDLKQEEINNIEHLSDNDNDNLNESKSNLEDNKNSDFDDADDESAEQDIDISELTMENLSNLTDLNLENDNIYNINITEVNDNADNDNVDTDVDNTDDDQENNEESNIEDMDFDDMDIDMSSIKVNLDSDKSNNLSVVVEDTTKVINITSNNNNENINSNDIVLKSLEDTTIKELKEIAKIVGVKSKGNKEELYNSINSKLNDD